MSQKTRLVLIAQQHGRNYAFARESFRLNASVRHFDENIPNDSLLQKCLSAIDRYEVLVDGKPVKRATISVEYGMFRKKQIQLIPYVVQLHPSYRVPALRSDSFLIPLDRYDYGSALLRDGQLPQVA